MSRCHSTTTNSFFMFFLHNSFTQYHDHSIRVLNTNFTHYIQSFVLNSEGIVLTLWAFQLITRTCFILSCNDATFSCCSCFCLLLIWFSALSCNNLSSTASAGSYSNTSTASVSVILLLTTHLFSCFQPLFFDFYPFLSTS